MRLPTHCFRQMSVRALLRSVLAGMFWMVSLHVVSQTKPILAVDLLAKGLPADAFVRTSYKDCRYQYFTYRSVEWLDSQLLMVAFSTSPSCAKNPGFLAGTLRVITFDLKGNALHSTDVPYDAGDGGAVRVIQNGGVWIGPSQSVIVQVPGSHLKVQPNSRDKVLVFSSELTPEQEIDTDSHENYYDALRFGGVAADRQSVLFWTSDGVVGHDRQCLLFRGRPLKQVGSCKSQDLDDLAG